MQTIIIPHLGGDEGPGRDPRRGPDRALLDRYWGFPPCLSPTLPPCSLCSEKPFIKKEVEISFSTATILWDKFLTPAYFPPQQMSHHSLIYNWSWFWEKWLWFLAAALWSLKRHRSWPVLVTSGLIMSESGCLVVWHQSWIRTLRWIRRKGAWQDIACDETEYPGTHPDLSKQICKHISHSQI